MSEYQKLRQRYHDAAKNPASPDHKIKGKMRGELRQMERAAAREGTILTPVLRGDTVIVEQSSAPSKRSLQEEYVRKFDAEKQVKLGEKPQTLREFHSKRLLGR